MQSQLTIRLPEDMEQKLSRYARQLRLKRSDIVRMALERLFSESVVQEERTPYDKVRTLIGAVSSGITDLGTKHREHLVKKIKKHA